MKPSAAFRTFGLLSVVCLTVFFDTGTDGKMEGSPFPWRSARTLDRVGIIDIEDHWLKIKGLALYLEDRGVAFRDLTRYVRQGKLDLEGLDALIIGSFATADPAVHEGIDKNAGLIRAFLVQGGVVVEFTQADQEQDLVGWLPDTHQARRCDTDHASMFLANPGHPLFTARANIDGSLLRACVLPKRLPAWETFSGHKGFRILGAADNEGAGAFILEGAIGRGRVLLFSMTADKVYTSTEPIRKKAARALLDNVIAYIEALPLGRLPAVKADDVLPPATIRASGTVFEDLDMDGERDAGEPPLSNIRVSNGIDIALTDGSGRFSLEMPLSRTRCIFPVIPDECELPGNLPYVRIPDREQNDVEIVFGLIKREDPVPDSFTFLQTTDIHVGRLTLSSLAEDVMQINRISPAPDLVFATGDIVETGTVVEQYCGYKTVMRRLKHPLINVIGNHDYNSGSNRTRNWERFLGPRYFSFDFCGHHMLCLDSISFDSPQQEWIEKDLALKPGDRPVLVFQHYLPTAEQLDLFSRHGVVAVFSGHWHGTREALYKGVMNINTATLRFGGIDRTARGFRVVIASPDGIRFDYRVGGLDRHMAVVSPQEGSTVPCGKVPIVVNSYDTALPPLGVKAVLLDPAAVAAASPGDQAAGEKMQALEPSGNWSWFGTTTTNTAGEKLLLAEATDGAGRTWKKSASFRVSDAARPAVEPGSDWPMFRGNAGNTGVASDAIKAPLSLAWAAAAGGGINIGSPVVADGRVYIGTLFIHDFHDCGITCMDARTGELLWRAGTDSSIKHAPCAAGGRVFAASVAGTLYAFDAASGEPLWEAELGAGDAQRWDTCAPKCVDGVVYAGRGGFFAAIDAQTGMRIWKVAEALDANWWPSIYASPAVGDEGVFLGSGKGLFAIDRASGKLLWHVKERAVSPVLSEGKLYAMLSNDAAVLDPATGQVLSRTGAGFGDETGCPAVLPGENPVLFTGGAGGEMSAFDLTSGLKSGSFCIENGIASMRPYQRGERTITSSPAVAGNLVIFGGNDGYLYLLDRHSMTQRQRFYIGAPIPGSPAISGNAVFIGAYDGNVYAFVSGAEQ